MPGRRYMKDISSASILAAKRLAGITEVNLKECVTRTDPPNVNKAAHSGFETQRRHHQNEVLRQLINEFHWRI